jgi:hypothetical protein
MEHLALTICIVGLLVYVIGSRVDDRVEELGRLCFFAGLLGVVLGK